MKYKIISMIGLLLICGGYSYSQYVPEIVNVIPSPLSSTMEIAFDGNSLWVGNSLGDLYKIDPSYGSILKSIHNVNINADGLTFNNEYLLAPSYFEKKIYLLDTTNANIVDSIIMPPSIGYIEGLAWDGINLWMNVFYIGTIDTIFKYNTSSSIIQKFPSMGHFSKGLTFDGQYLWASDNTNNPVIYKIDTLTGNVIDTLVAPGGNYPNGLTWDGNYLWVSNNSSDSLYQIDVSTYLSYQNEISQEDSVNQQEILIYPNPNTGHFFIEKPNGLNKEVIAKLLDATSKTIIEKVIPVSQRKVDMDITSYSKGIYYLQLIIDDKIFIKQILKN